MAVPKKCRSKTKRNIKHSRKILNKKPGRSFSGLLIDYRNVTKCKNCNNILKSHTHCYPCIMQKILLS